MSTAERAFPAITEYSLQSTTLATVDGRLLSQWKSLYRQSSFASPMHDPEWLRGYFEGEESNLFLYLLRQSDQLCGVAAFLKTDWPMKCHIGELTVATFPLTRLRLLGDTPAFPPENAAYDLLFTELATARSDFDSLYLEEVPVSSFLWNYLQTNALIHKSFLMYQPQPVSPHPLLRLEGSFEQYMKKFNSKHRNTLLRKIKKVREGILGEMRFVRFELPEDVPAFLEEAVNVSRKTYQWTLHQKGLSATDVIRRRLLFAAKHGWMRSYLLFCGGRACAFLLGFQHGGCFQLYEIGFDPELAKYSIGTVLQFLTVEDLFSHNRPVVFDLQDYNQYKDVLSTESYPQVKAFLFRPSIYAHLIRAGHRGTELTNRFLSSSLDRCNLKGKLRQRMRGWTRSK